MAKSRTIDARLYARAKDALKKYFGYEDFKDSQERIIRTLLKGQDVLAVMPTGAGKSLCFQLPALLLDGITIVVTPINALMRNQCESLNELLVQNGMTNVGATFINSERKPDELNRELYDKKRRIKLIYVSPERLHYDAFQRFINTKKVSMLVVDEAHCVSMWGFDFRQAYLNIPAFYRALPERPILAAFTATALNRVVDDIKNILCMELPEGAINEEKPRQRLNFSVVKIGKRCELEERLLKDVGDHAGELGIIYCLTIYNVNAVYELLKKNGVRVGKYHGLKNEDDEFAEEQDWDRINEINREHREVLRQFECDEIDCVVATSAFGMGIDKKIGRDVTYVIHYDVPLNLENYYQEAGRGARMKSTGSCDCILYYTNMAIPFIKKAFIKKMAPDKSPEMREYLQGLANERLEQMEKYIKCADKAAFLEKYFASFEPAIPDNPEITEWHGRLLERGPAYLYINNTHFARELRHCKKRTSGEFKERLKTGETVVNRYVIKGNEELKYFDLMVMDAIYSLARSGMNEFSSLTVLQVLAGNSKVKVKSNVRPDIEESIERLQTLRLDYDSIKIKETDCAGADGENIEPLAKGSTVGDENGVRLEHIRDSQFLCTLSQVKKRNGNLYVLKFKNGNEYTKPFFYRNAEKSAMGQWLVVPLEDVGLVGVGGKPLLQVTKEWLQIKYYLLNRIKYLNLRDVKINKSVSFDSMIRELGIYEYVESSQKTSEKRVLAKIEEILAAFKRMGYLADYRFRRVKAEAGSDGKRQSAKAESDGKSKGTKACNALGGVCGGYGRVHGLYGTVNGETGVYGTVELFPDYGNLK